MAKKDFPDDCAFVYRGARVYHTLRDLSAGRQNATCSENWLTWKFSDRDMDSPEGNQFDLRELSKAPSGYADRTIVRHCLGAVGSIGRGQERCIPTIESSLPAGWLS